jgi:cytochrome c peroxidase
VEAWIASLPRPPASKRLDSLAVSRGRQLFANGGCAACHGGPLWTVSRIPYVPSFAKNGSAVGDDGVPSAPSGLRLEQRNAMPLWNPSLNTDTLKVAPEQVMIDGGAVTIGPERITCVLRNVGTFDRQDPLEVKSTGQPAQGELGFNPPSLFGLSTSAPYLHHGKAKTLEELFSAPFAAHHQAAAAGFLTEGDGGVNAGEVSDLVAFLESIDEGTLPFAIPFGTDVCGAY